MYQARFDYVCDYCSRMFTRKYNLQTHIENWHVSSSSYCDICDQRYGSPAGLQLHLSRGHNRFGQPFPECDICGRIFTRRQNIVSHMLTVHQQRYVPNIKCNYCEKYFTTERNLRRHVSQMHNPSLMYPTCDVCQRSFKKKDSLIAHIQSTHNVSKTSSTRCDLCDKVYTNSRNLKRHTEMFHGEKEEFKCEICPKVYTSNQSLKRHTRTRHYTTSQEQFSCEYCPTLITGQENLNVHALSFHKPAIKAMEEDNAVEISNYSCETCGRKFDFEPLLRHHTKTEHSFQIFYEYCKKSLLQQTPKLEEKVTANIYKCEYCGLGLSSIYLLKDHMRLKHEREYILSTCNVCYKKFYSREILALHKKLCLPPKDVNNCSHCDKLFTDASSLEFHTRIFHPHAQIADNKISSTYTESNDCEFKCEHCNRVYYSDRSLKHHVKLKHTTDEAVECEFCGKICSNKYYLASHVKMVHNDCDWSKCDYCDKQFKSKRNIRRHIEYTHMGMQRYKCVECETLFKEKRSLRKHVRTKHPNSVSFPQCHICNKRFESAKSCKIHLKLLHSFNMNTYPCGHCPVSFSSNEALTIHLQTKHLAEDEIYKCEDCNLVFKGQDKFDQHNEIYHVSFVPTIKQKVLPRCIICMKDFSTRKTLKRHIKKFHEELDVEELATYGTRKRIFMLQCEDCPKYFNDENLINGYNKVKHISDSLIFACETCNTPYNALEFSIQRYKINYEHSKSKMILSDLCTAEMSDGEDKDESTLQEMEPESTTADIQLETIEILSESEIKQENMSP